MVEVGAQLLQPLTAIHPNSSQFDNVESAAGHVNHSLFWKNLTPAKVSPYMHWNGSHTMQPCLSQSLPHVFPDN